MKFTFLIIFLLLTGFSIASALTRHHDIHDNAPVLYWMTDVNPTRKSQLEAFQQWLTKIHGPAMHIKLDESMVGSSGSSSANVNPDAKMVMQGVSGVLGDLVNVPTTTLSYLQDIGILQDLTTPARELGFTPAATFPAAKSQITYQTRQYLFPENIAFNLLILNKATFNKYHFPLPPRRWTLQQFEEIGKKFVSVANPPNTPQSQRVFFADRFEAEDLRRTMGLSDFNETLTASTLDDPRNIAALNLMRHWSNDLHLLPTQADAASFASTGGYGGAAPQLLKGGQCAMVLYPLNLLIPLRQFDQPLNLGAVEMPNAGFPCILMRSRGTGVYRGSRNPDLAKYFVAFLASEDYNERIIQDCDALPPCPRYIHDDRFLKPVGHENEWELRQAFADASTTLPIPVVVSDFVHYHTSNHIELSWQEAFLSNICSAATAAQNAKREVDNQIQQSLTDDPALRPRYQAALALQKKIDALKREKKKIPLEWITNPFYQRYYQEMGQLSPPLADGRRENVFR